MSASTNASAGKLSQIYKLIKQSLNGEELDFTEGSIRKAVILLSIPMMLEMAMESVFALVFNKVAHEKVINKYLVMILSGNSIILLKNWYICRNYGLRKRKRKAGKATRTYC